MKTSLVWLLSAATLVVAKPASRAKHQSSRRRADAGPLCSFLEKYAKQISTVSELAFLFHALSGYQTYELKAVVKSSTVLNHAVSYIPVMLMSVRHFWRLVTPEDSKQQKQIDTAYLLAAASIFATRAPARTHFLKMDVLNVLTTDNIFMVMGLVGAFASQLKPKDVGAKLTAVNDFDAAQDCPADLSADECESLKNDPTAKERLTTQLNDQASGYEIVVFVVAAFVSIASLPHGLDEKVAMFLWNAHPTDLCFNDLYQKFTVLNNLFAYFSLQSLKDGPYKNLFALVATFPALAPAGSLLVWRNYM